MIISTVEIDGGKKTAQRTEMFQGRNSEAIY
jgi:hypothetical protein